MKHLNMQSLDKVAANIAKLQELFPNCVTETINTEGKLEHAIDFDMLKQELSDHVVDGFAERYQFTWPDKRKAILAANAPINKTLRPCREESVDFDNTENLYIEGDNLEVLKLLQETYLGRVKMIYIDPPYNTGNDFVYEDDFKENIEDYIKSTDQLDDEGNRMVTNTESNGRFHTDWLNMMYPRLKLAKDLLSDDGVIFISIDDNEVDNLRKVCDEIFGESNFITQLVWEKKKKGAFLSKNYINMKEYIVSYCKNNALFNGLVGEVTETEETYPCIKTTNARGIRIIRKGTPSRYKKSNYNIPCGSRISSGNMELIYLDDAIIKNNILQSDVKIDSNWIYSQNTLDNFSSKNLLYITQDNYIRRIVSETRVKMLKDLFYRVGTDGQSLSTYSYDKNLNNGGWGTNEDANDELHQLFSKQYIFDFSKPVRLIGKLIQSVYDSNIIVLDFFSGSATTAHAVMQLNAEDGGKRKFIMVQLPEICDENSEAYKAGYKNICEIGKERIRRAGKKIKEENPLTTQDLDIGFRVLKCDSSNMTDVYYTPKEYLDKQQDLFQDNIKEGRSDEDLLFQVMLELDTPLSSKIEKMQIAGKVVYNVAQGHLMACFDKDVTDEVISAIAKEMPSYFVMRDSSLANDSVAINFEQIFNTYSPQTVRSVL